MITVLIAVFTSVCWSVNVIVVLFASILIIVCGAVALLSIPRTARRGHTCESSVRVQTVQTQHRSISIPFPSLPLKRPSCYRKKNYCPRLSNLVENGCDMDIVVLCRLQTIYPGGSDNTVLISEQTSPSLGLPSYCGRDESLSS